jgi:hypothetical protein
METKSAPPKQGNDWLYAQRELVRSFEVKEDFENKYKTKISSIAVGRELSQAEAALLKPQIDIGHGERDRLFAIYNLDYWRMAGSVEIRNRFLIERRLAAAGENAKPVERVEGRVRGS